MPWDFVLWWPTTSACVKNFATAKSEIVPQTLSLSLCCLFDLFFSQCLKIHFFFPEKIPSQTKHFPEKKKMSDALINGLSGAGGGIIAQLITYPLQTVQNSTSLWFSLFAFQFFKAWLCCCCCCTGSFSFDNFSFCCFELICRWILVNKQSVIWRRRRGSSEQFNKCARSLSLSLSLSLSPCGYLNNYIIMLLLENCFDLISVKVKIGFGFVFPTFLATKQNCTFNFI